MRTLNLQLAKNYKKFYGLIGLLFIIISFLYWYLPSTKTFIIPAHFIFYIGNIFFFDYISYYFSGFSFLHSTKNYIRLLLHFFIVGGVLFGIIAEIYIHWLGKFWYYPGYGSIPYFVGMPLIFTVYAFYLLETYMGTKAVLEYFFKKHKRRKESFAGLKKIFIFFGLVGAIGFGASSIYLALRTTFGQNLEDFLSIINTPFRNDPSIFVVTIIATICFWLLLEYIEYERHETSMLYEIIKGNLFPAMAVFLSAWFSAVIYEIFNLPGKAWWYSNIPFSGITIFDIPIFVFIMWPFHYFPLFSLYRVIFKKETERIWE